MYQVGTSNGRPVMAGLAKLYYQEGIPYNLVFEQLRNKDIVVSWIHLYKELQDNGLSHDRIIHLLNEHVFEAYGAEYRDVVIDRLEQLFSI